MNGAELVKEILALAEIHGDLPVYHWADHGQIAEASYSVELGYIEEESGDLIHEDDVEQWDGYDLKKVILIG